MSSEKSVSVIIPTLNEREGIDDVIEGIPINSLKKFGYQVEILIVDGGSTDGTVEKVEKMGLDVIHCNGGKAEGVREGLKKAEGDYVFLIDGDDSYPPERIEDMVKELENGSDMILGSRFQGEINDGAMTAKNKIGNKILTWIANNLYGTEVSDLCTGLRGLRVNGLEAESIPGKGFEIEAGLHTLFSEKDISEIGIRYAERKGDSKLKTRDGFKIAIRLIKEKFEEN